MKNDNAKIIALLTEMRDGQKRQLDRYERDVVWQKAMQEKALRQQRIVVPFILTVLVVAIALIIAL